MKPIRLHTLFRSRDTKVMFAGISLMLVLAACGVGSTLSTDAVRDTDWKSKLIAQDYQQTNGNPALGFAYMKQGAYLGTGLPAEVIKGIMQKDSVKFLRNSGLVTPHGIAFFTSANGVEVANGTCFTCHAGAVAGDTILGIGNSLSDYRGSLRLSAKLLNTRMKLRYDESDPEYIQYEDFGHYFSAMAEGTETNQPGVNPAARIAETIMRYRDPQTLEYTPTPAYEIEAYNLASDTPPLWNVAKKNALYYTAVGRGDMTKLLFQASVLGIPDSTQAREAQRAFVDVLAWLRDLKPPAYPGEVDPVLAKAGKLIFDETCSGCHGNYGKIGGDRSDDTYPNKVISVGSVGTDPLYAAYAVNSGITNWYNKSWFATSYPQSRFEPEAGYIAPPLDGIWATAPYLHNGSVPTIALMLNSEQRPEYWAREGANGGTPTGAFEEYDFENLGWKFSARDNSRGKHTYDTTLPGYSKSGHAYGDKLSAEQRGAVLEYLKTL